MRRSCALATPIHDALVAHLDRPDGQEDLCFAVYQESTGHDRHSALISELVLPADGEPHVHGNVSFASDYFLRATDVAAAAGRGLALLHSHPGGGGWQDMSPDDVTAERRYAAQTLALAGKPLLGLMLGTGDQAWSARVWARHGRDYRREDCETVLVVGQQLAVTHHPTLSPAPSFDQRLLRTMSVWGDEVQSDLARLRIAVVGLGSVGSMIAEALARICIGHLVLIDFDSVKLHNLDRLLHATALDHAAARAKVEVMAKALRRSAAHPQFTVEPLELSVIEPAGFAAALDCDVVFSCVDRPWPRQLLNLIAYAHLIPVIDGGIRATAKHGRWISADWKAHIAAPTRRCLECLSQFDPAAVAAERDGLLDDPKYLEGLPADHPFKTRENVRDRAAAGS